MSVRAVIQFKIDEQPFVLPLTDDATLGLTPREHMRIAALCGVRGVKGIGEGLQVMDIALLSALAVVAAERAGAEVDADAIFDGKSTVSWQEPDDEDDDDPPPAEDVVVSTTSPSPTTQDHSGVPC